jgi:hypothetical protein
MSYVALKSFLPSEGFAGRKQGYCFRNGPQGVGYYVDAAQQPPPSQSQQQVNRFVYYLPKSQVDTTRKYITVCL